MIKDFIAFLTGSKWGIILIAIAVSFAGGGYLGWHERALREPAMLSAQQEADTKQCNADKEITKESNHDLKTNLDVVSAELARLKRVRSARCVAVATGQAGAADVRGEHAGQNDHGLSSDWLYDYAAQCESVRQGYISCTGFVDKVWAEHGQ